jgi:Spy/CpxP family protein refolding chaperone
MTVSGSRARTLGVILLGLIFAAGIAAGVAADRVLGAGQVLRVKLETPDAGVLDKLGLTPEQRGRAEAIMARRAPRTEAMMLEVGERLQLIADSVDAEFRAILTPEQRIRLDSLHAGQRLLLKRKVTRPDGSVVTDTVFPRDRVP